MAMLLIGYDLNKTGQDYSGLIGAIRENFGTRWRRLDSTWIVSTSLSPATVRDLLLPYIDVNDELLVITVSAPAAWYGFDDSGSQWLIDNLK